MKFELTSSQKIFYVKNGNTDDKIWNQGIVQKFNKVYDYRQLNDAFNDLVRNNESLLVSFEHTASDAFMQLNEFEYIDYPLLLLSSEDEIEAELNKFLNETISLDDKLVRCIIFQTPVSSGYLINTHHIIVDGFSGLVMAEHINNYLKNPDSISPATQRYSEYVEKESKYRQSKRFQRGKQFWTEKFSADPLCRITPKDAALFDYTSDIVTYDFSDIFFKKIESFCENKGISISSFFNLIFSIYFHRFYDINNFTVGVPVLNRTTQSELNTIGLYMHILPMIVNLTDESFLSNIEKTENSHIDLFRYQSFTQHDIREILNETKVNTGALFDVALDYEQLPTSEDYDIDICYSDALSLSLEIHVFNMSDVKKLKIRYRTALFSESDINIMIKSVISLAEDAIEHPDKKISELNMISDSEKILLNSFNNTDHSYSHTINPTLYSLFEKTAQENENKVCIRTAEKNYTFGELLTVSEKLDAEIRNITKGKKSVIAVISERSIEMYAAIYGIIRGGNAYLPIDPDYPQDRIEYILKNSNSAAVVVQGKFADKSAGVPCIDMTEFLVCDKIYENIPESGAVKDDTAYVIYTSGSTGTPKGAKVSHKSAVNRILWMHDKYPLGSDDVILQKTPYTFDVSVWELFWWSMVGAGLAVSKPGEHFLPAKILEEVEDKKVTHLHFVPSVLEIFLRYLETHKEEVKKFRSVRYVFVSGEALMASLVQRFYALFDYDKVTLHNLYGPTECAVDVTYYDCIPEDADPVPIGKPIYNTQMYVVDKYMNLQPVGVIGELCIAGTNVGQGYLNNPELTAEKFIDNPFGEGKLYKTGDLAYWREDGNIVFVGRNDHQVKIRGLRIELGEIENAISSIAGIAHSAVVVRSDNSDRQFICAFYTGKEKSVKEIKEQIGKSLPQYMIPHVIVYLEKMPLTSSGKIDRKSLPEFDFENIISEIEYVAPVSDKEEMLIECACGVLGVDRISMLDNFFNIGGDSLKAIELTAVLESKGYTVSVKTVFSSKDMRELAEKLEEGKIEYEKTEYSSVLPATAAQLRVYTSQLLKAELAHYNIPYAFKAAALDAEKLENAVNELIKRHESLRTRFENRDGQIVQIIEPVARVNVEKLESDNVDLFNTPFDLSKAPLVKVGYFENTVIVVMHHIISDGESMNIFFKELNELYMGRELGETVQYGEFAVTDNYSEVNEKFWLDVFSEEISVCELKKDFPRPEKQSFIGSQIYDFIDIGTHNAICEKCRKTGITPYAYYMACYSLLISKFSSCEDVVVATPVSGRSGRYLETVGMFVNTIALRCKPEGEKRISSFLDEIKNISVDAIENQSYPLSELLKKLQINVSSTNPMTNLMFTYQSEESTDIIFADNKAEMLPVPLAGVKSELAFTLMPKKNDLVLLAEYSTDLFKDETVRSFIEAYKNILVQVLDEDKHIKDITVVTEQESNKLLYEFNDTAVEYDKEKCVHKLIEIQAENTPEKIAVIASDKVLTYRELNEAANRIAGALEEMSVGRGDIVGLMLPRRSSLMAALLGVLKTGAAYLPIDPALPEERIEYMLSDSGARICITENNISDLLENENIINPANNVGAEEMCYCIYTSGSTGKAKGTLIYHRNLVWYMSSLKRIYKSESINMPVFTSQSVDLTVTSLFLPLVSGGTVYLYDGELRENLIEIFTNDNLSMIKMTPTHMDIVCRLVPDRECVNLKNVIVGGEALYAEACNRFLGKFGSHIKIHNEYGPTETTVGCMDYVFEESTDDKSVPIGKPADNVQMYIIDRYSNLVPLGVTGELCVAGDGVGAGYHNNPELTAEKFIDNPFGEGKLYKTGDLAYWREDGNIVFVGRNDFQVKVRGLRIELGEIESTIRSVDGVLQCASTVKTDTTGNQYICAYYTGVEKSAKELRKETGKSLPQYMIPHVFVYLKELPMTSSGKFDRKALPEVDLSAVSAEEEFLVPVTVYEKALAEAVSSILGVSSVNMADNFFNAGGDSILAIYLVSELEEMGYSIHVADVMQKETFADIAGAMDYISDKTMYDQGEASGFVPLTPIMRAFIKENDVIPEDYVHKCILSVDCDESTVKKALDAIVSHHDMLRGYFVDGGIHIPLSTEGETYEFESVCVENETGVRENLENVSKDSGKLFHAVYCKTEKECLVSLIVHHFIIDFVSWEIIVKDLRTAINQIKKREEISLASKTASFIMWAEALEKYSGTISKENREYWSGINRRLDEVATLHCEEENDAESYSFTFDKITSDKLINKVNDAYSTRTNEVILTALGLAVTKNAGGSVGISVESHGRAELAEPIAIERTVGWFTACYPVVINGGNAVEELINVKETLRRIPKNGIDYLLLSDGLHKNADVIFNYYKTELPVGEQEMVFSGNTVFPGKINVSAVVVGNTLSIYISVPKCNHRKNICEELGIQFKKELEELVDILMNTEKVRTCSDFSDASLIPEELDEMKKLYGDSNIKDIYALTPTQEGIYTQYFQNNITKTYQLHNLCRISKQADMYILEKSMELLSHRHQVLKTAVTVLKTSGKIKQAVLESRKPEFTLIKINETFSQCALDKIISEDADKPLDLEKDSLFKAVIIDFTDERFMLIHTHHIIIDGWCLPVLINDLQRYYSELLIGKPNGELTAEISKEVISETSYAHYVKWIKNQHENEAYEYWNNLLSDFSETHLFGKAQKDSLKNEKAVVSNITLTQELTRRIEEFAGKNRISNNTVFETVFSIVLLKYSGSTEVVFDKIISGRSIPVKNIENTVGPFINTVPVRVKDDGKKKLSALFDEIQTQTVNANKYGVLPLSEVYRTAGIDSRAIDALFVFENYYSGDISDVVKGPLSPEVLSFAEQTEFNLTVTVFKENGQYTVRASYFEDMYTESEMKAFLDSYISVIDSSLDGEKLIKDISVADKAFVESVNNTGYIYNIPEDSTIFSIFEKTAKDNSGKVCLSAEKSLTFDELLSVSERLDAKLREIIGNKKSIVAVVAERSTEMYAAIYGIIRGGNAYLPIDPDYPKERIDYILKNSEAAAVVVQGNFKNKISNVACVDITEFLKNPEELYIPECAAEADDTAYVIYTSGSTGTPKGAKISHRSAVNRVLWMHNKYPLEKADVILQKTPYTFDVSVWEIFWWGMVGGKLAASKPDEHFLPAKILEEVNNNKVTHLHFVPSVFEIFLDYLEKHTNEAEKFASVRYVFLSGEALMASLVQRFYNLFDSKKVTIHNLYGPTECAVDVTYYDCADEEFDPVPIGKPIYNTQMYVVDRNVQLQPVGVTGELCIAGINVGQGYHNNPELTAEKFIDNPFGEGKLYKTGDLAYLREDGNIIFCGRKDSQIKLNGQRIELGEIETVISGIKDVVTSAVIIKKVGDKDILIAFYTGEKLDSVFIKSICSSKLPRYMVPSAFVHMQELPLNQSGKLDRRALEEKEFDVANEIESGAPVNEREKYICDKFEELLGIKNVGRSSDFFDLGGTSLSMISLLSEEGFEKISAAEFMRNPTPAALAALMHSTRVTDCEYLEELYATEKAKKAFVLFPFAGGGAEAYINLVSSFKQRNEDMAIYYVRYLHSLDECEKAAKEIIKLLGDKNIYIYSHCVGSAVALQILKVIETEGVKVERYFAAASIPPVKPSEKNAWNLVPDRILKAILLKAGADLRGLSDERVRTILCNFRKDTDFAGVSFSALKERIKTPISIILSKKDPFTRKHSYAAKLWSSYSCSKPDISFIESKSHYFQSDNSDELSEIIIKNLIINSDIYQ